ncbi:hypothetical protein OU415_11270 [Saccharopolyspora sp. WRP15-2]|uniref:Uncharacterized protein n=1 Tax=Saccharopolyspora oryzae TaxID=2997343 RepID=A0ABT4UWD2_9PSEU|nr:hypothetical protein [Saccharopolyspora oryzae]MDA3626017.1 hypothetical protein [Saccharopolyspora oryzae]
MPARQDSPNGRTTSPVTATDPSRIVDHQDEMSNASLSHLHRNLRFHMSSGRYRHIPPTLPWKTRAVPQEAIDFGGLGALLAPQIPIDELGVSLQVEREPYCRLEVLDLRTHLVGPLSRIDST